MSGHYATVDLGPYGPSFQYECHEPDGAACRLVGGPDCQCERWTAERDWRGPFHNVTDEFGGFIARHDMREDDECNVVNYLADSDPPFADDARIRLRIKPVWDGDGYIVEDFEVAS